MGRRLKTILTFFLLIISGLALAAQDHEHAPGDGHPIDTEHNRSGHKITLVMAYSVIDNSFAAETNDILLVPTFGLNYDFFINARWGIGLHTDIMLQQYKVEKHGSHEEILRENPVAICGMAVFKPHHRWILMAGYGVEVEKHESFQMIRAGVE